MGTQDAQHQLTTFASPDAGPIGHVIEGDVRILATPLDRAPLGLPASPIDIDETRVGLYTISFDDDGALLAHIAGAYQGWWSLASASGMSRRGSHPCWAISPIRCRSC